MKDQIIMYERKGDSIQYTVDAAEKSGTRKKTEAEYVLCVREKNDEREMGATERREVK